MKKLIIILSVLAVIGGIVTLAFIQDKKKQEAIAAAAQQALDNEIKKIKDLTVEIITRADKFTTTYPDQARGYLSYSKHVVKTEKEKIAEAPRTKSGKPASVDKYAPRADRDGVPMGMMTREELDRMRSKKRGEPVKKTTGEETTPEPEPTQQFVKKAVVDEGPAEPEISMLARKVTDEIKKVGVEAIKVKDLASQATDIRDRAMKATDYKLAKKEAVYLPELLTGIKNSEKIAKKAISDAKSAARNVDSYISRQAAAKEKARKDAEEQATIKREIAQAKEILTTIPPIIQQNDFKKAYTAISKSLSRFSRDEALQILELEVARCKYMIELKDFIKEELTENKFKWGWTQDKPNSDITGATDAFIQTTTKRIAWEDLKLAQTIKIINHVLSTTKKPKSTKAKMYFAAAIYFKNQEGTETLSSQCAAKAMQLSDKYQAEEKRLLR